ncbi:TonB-dependent siderophore receptor [Stenotrophomonas sp.]|uniref:TonB-dependent siderophore receptor n=1 Tax=Stenotrophomonas sp. TaxID=69392 RepID=UPI0028AA0EF1|nr:TonB-dependent siderophore receptor [Stenotrophomonas sp.]
MSARVLLSRHPLSAALALGALLAGPAMAEGVAAATDIDTVHVTAEQIAKQALGSSVITSVDLERLPPANDLSEVIRRMPGINLTGNTASGSYGNFRQIDIRGMGPENTLILIDGRPVSSRDSVRMGRSGERNSRGDSNWVPAEAVERIEVLRGPAAARYGSGASGGVVNIITKKPTGDLTGSLTLYGSQAEHSEEGDSERVGFQLSGPLSEQLSFRLFGNANKTDADSLYLNEEFATGVTPPAGREGVRNRDISGLLRYDINDKHVLELDASVSRQGNIYSGERGVSGDGFERLNALYGAETNVMLRRSFGLTHRGSYDWGTSRITAAYDDTDNTRLNEGLAGGPEGSITEGATISTSELTAARVDGEINVPLNWGGIEQVATLGFEYRDMQLDDPYSVTQSSGSGGGIPGYDGVRTGKSDQQFAAVFIEDNLYVGDRWTLTPGLRFDHHSQFGNNLSPSLNVQFKLAQDWAIKGGIARAFKAPNLYQANPDYLYYTRGNGCPVLSPNMGSGCYVMGNADLDPETSINKEIGIEWAPDNGWHASVTYFHNDYKDKIVAGQDRIGVTNDTLGQVFQWTNAPKALIRGVEGNIKVPLVADGDVLSWNTNVTWMIENVDKTTDQPLSIIPEYTVNTFLDWQVNAQLSFMLTGTFYGKQESATQSSTTGALLPPDTRASYDLWSLGGQYRITPKVRVGGGVNNLFDKRLFREGTTSTSATGAGADTYNEPGRSYWVNLTVGF